VSCTRYDLVEIISNSQNLANFSAFEVDDEVLGNLREYGLANSLYWALAEGHACEQSARRNAMDVSINENPIILTIADNSRRTPPRTLVR
jgi:F0F1-type ATP synthase gamma subunit